MRRKRSRPSPLDYSRFNQITREHIRAAIDTLIMDSATDYIGITIGGSETCAMIDDDGQNLQVYLPLGGFSAEVRTQAPDLFEPAMTFDESADGYNVYLEHSEADRTQAVDLILLYLREILGARPDAGLRVAVEPTPQ